MTLNPGYIESQERNLKKQSLLLHLGCQMSLITGLGLITLSPFLTSNKIIRVSCLTGGFLLGCNVVLTASLLQNTTQKAKALEKAVKENFGLQLVTNQIIIQDNLKAQLIPQPQPEYATNTEQIQPEYIDNPNNSQINESAIIEIEEPRYNEVIAAIEDGKSDSYIIQDVLGYKGRNYQEGKRVLTEIKGQIEYE